MTPRRLQLGLALFMVLSSAVLVNAVIIQGASRTRGPHIELGPSPEVPHTAGRSADGRPVETPSGDAAASGETVRAIQRELETRGYGIGPADGVPGLATRAAILAYEVDNGLPLTADPSADLLRAMILGGAGPAPTAPDSRTGPHADQLIRTVQQSLAGIGYGPVKIDGHLGTETVRAIRRFERDTGLPETGRISAQIVAKLAKLAAQGQVRSRN